MSYNLGTDEEPIIVFASYSGGILDASTRSVDYDTFMANTITAGLRYPLTIAVTDEETGEVTHEPTGEYATAKGVDINHIGSVVVTAGTYDADGNELTPPIIDTRHHADIRMMPPATDQVDEYGITKWHIWSMQWMFGGVDDTNRNASEEGKSMYGTTLLDTDTINSKTVVWA